MKVMLVIPHVSGGGGEKVLSDLACNLRAEIVVVVFEEKFTYPIKGKVITLNAPINRTSPLTRAYGFMRRIVRFRRVVRDERPDIVLSFMGEANFINALVSPRPVLAVHTHFSAIGEMRNSIERVAVKVLVTWLYRRAMVTTVSNAVKADLVERFGVPDRQIVVIPNAVDVSRITDMAGEPVDCPWNSDVPVIITVGRLTHEKAHTHLIRAFAEVRKFRPCQLAIIGTGELELELKNLVQEHRVETDVFFLGWQSNPFKFIARADLFVLSSLTEAFPLVLLEAMACKVPVIATDGPGGSREIITGGTAGRVGVLVPPPNRAGAEQELVREILNLLDDEAARQRYSEAGQARVREFDAAEFIKKYQRLLEQQMRSRGTHDTTNNKGAFGDAFLLI